MTEGRRVVILGDSHSRALREAIETMAQQGRAPAAISIKQFTTAGRLRSPFYEQTESELRIRFQPKLAPLDEDRFPDPEVCYGLVGNLNSKPMLQAGSWDIYAPFDFLNGELPISLQALDQVFAEDQQHMLAFIDAIKAQGGRVFAVDTPRLFAGHPMLSEVRPSLVMDLDRRFRAFVRRQFDLRGVPVVDAPAHTIDASGSTLECYRREDEIDGYHANAAFGELMIGEIAAFQRDWLPTR